MSDRDVIAALQRTLAESEIALRASHEREGKLHAALVAIASRVSPESKHQEWAAANGCDCVVCVAVAALKALDSK